MDGLFGSTRAPTPSSTSSNAGSTLVPPGATRPMISDTASTASTSASTDSSSHAPSPATTRRAPSAERVADLAEDAGLGVGDRFAARCRVFREELSLALRQARRDDDVDEDVQVA